MVSEERLEQISKVLEIPVDIIKNFTEQFVFNSCTQSGYIYNQYNNSVEEIKNLYERLLKEKDERIQELQSRFKNK